jgi:hypothetical protein
MFVVMPPCSFSKHVYVKRVDVFTAVVWDVSVMFRMSMLPLSSGLKELVSS